VRLVVANGEAAGGGSKFGSGAVLRRARHTGAPAPRCRRRGSRRRTGGGRIR
jgi:hypothetical protein